MTGQFSNPRNLVREIKKKNRKYKDYKTQIKNNNFYRYIWVLRTVVKIFNFNTILHDYSEYFIGQKGLLQTTEKAHFTIISIAQTIDNTFQVQENIDPEAKVSATLVSGFCHREL